MTIFLIVILAGCGVMIYRAMRRQQADAEALYWATLKTPLYFLSETAFDTTVEARANEAKQNLLKFGNKYLVHNGMVAVWCEVYGANMGVFGRNNVSAMQQNHSTWHALATQEMMQRKANWIAQRAEWLGDKSGQVFGGQINNN